MKRFISLILIAILVMSLFSCTPDEVPPETLEWPNADSLVTYTISNSESLVLFYNDESQSYGEWIKDGVTTRVYVQKRIEYWGLFTGRMGVTQYCLELYKIEDIQMYANTTVASILTPKVSYKLGEKIGILNAGSLNSTVVTDIVLDNEKTIQNISISTATFDDWDWEWFDENLWNAYIESANTPTEENYFTADGLDLWYNPWRNMGEWKVGETVIPIKIHFYEEAMAIAVYDVSNNGSNLILLANGYLKEDNQSVFIADNVSISVNGDNMPSVTTFNLQKTEGPNSLYHPKLLYLMSIVSYVYTQE